MLMQVKTAILGLCASIFLLTSCNKEESVKPNADRTILYGISSISNSADATFLINSQDVANMDEVVLSVNGEVKLNNQPTDIGTVTLGPLNIDFNNETYYNYGSELVNKQSAYFTGLFGNAINVSLGNQAFGTYSSTLKTVSDFDAVFPDYPEHAISKNSDLTFTWTPDPLSDVDLGVYVYSSGHVSNKISDPSIDSTLRFKKLFLLNSDPGTFTVPASTWNNWPTNSIVQVFVGKAKIGEVQTSNGKKINLGSYITSEASYVLK